MAGSFRRARCLRRGAQASVSTHSRQRRGRRGRGRPNRGGFGVRGPADGRPARPGSARPAADRHRRAAPTAAPAGRWSPPATRECPDGGVRHRTAGVWCCPARTLTDLPPATRPLDRGAAVDLLDELGDRADDACRQQRGPAAGKTGPAARVDQHGVQPGLHTRRRRRVDAGPDQDGGPRRAPRSRAAHRGAAADSASRRHRVQPPSRR